MFICSVLAVGHTLNLAGIVLVHLLLMVNRQVSVKGTEMYVYLCKIEFVMSVCPGCWLYWLAAVV